MLLICSWSLHSWAAPGGKINGSYEVKVAGDFTGKGTIAVGEKSVTITLHVVDEAGNKGLLHAANLTLTDGRFSGKGTVLGAAMDISGRVDLPDAEGPIKAATIQATFLTGAGKAGRIVGARRGHPK